ncbi:MAG TPA: hypothetical protein VGR07_21165 [Thermoanaerobaculia bacterium]|jgi:hypothetical protein|nr:hypothetical protein [Thermoanaerobaculia bacterium]
MRPGINALEIRLAALRRSGSHAVVHWLLRQLPGRGVFLNSCKPGENPYASCYRGDSLACPADPEAAAAGIDLDRERDQGPSPKDFLLYNFEDRELPAVFSDAFEVAHDGWLGTSVRRFDLLVLRDPWNNLASLLRWARGAVYPISLDSVAKAARLWKGYAREALGETAYLRHGRTPVLFNRWVTDPAYRAELAERLGVPFTDAGRDEVAPWGPTTWGDSFDGLAYDGRAGEMPVLERWRWCADDPFYRGLFDPEMIELAARIFGPRPGDLA